MQQALLFRRLRLARVVSVWMLALAWLFLPTLAHATVSVSKQFLPLFAGTVSAGLPVTTASQGDVLTLGIDIQNNNLLLTGGVLTDPLPLGMVLAPLPNPRATAGCAPAGITFFALPGAATFSLSGAQVPPQVGNVPGACSIYVDVTVPLTLATVPNTLTTLNNTIPVTTGFTALDTATNAPIKNLMPAQRSITVTSLAALQVAKTFAPATVVMGETTNIQITLTNPNAVPVGVTSLGENLPAGLTAQNLTPLFQGVCSTATAAASGASGNVTLTFTNLTLPANGACTLVWPAQVAMFPGLASTTLTNTIPANTLVNSRGLSQAVATRNLTVQAPLNPTKTLTPATAATNQPVAMTISLQNRSATQTLSAVNFSDVFPVAPGAMTLSPGAITATGCGAPTLTPTLALGGETSLLVGGATIAPGATCVITASVQVNTAGAYTNTVNAVSYTSNNPLVGAQTTGAFSAPLTAYSQMLIAAKAARDPRVGTNAAAGNVAPGNLLRYQVTLNNYSSAQQALVSFVDPLPASGAAQLTFVPAPAPIFGASCGAPTISPNTLANPALVQFDNIAIAGGTTAAPTACTIDFWVQVPMNWPVGTAINNGSTMDLQQNALSVLQGARPTANSATRAGITTAQTIAPATILQGDLSLLTITLTNNNYVDVLNASLLNTPLFAATVAAEVRLADLPGASTTCGGTPVFTALAGTTSLAASGLTIPARGSCTVTVRVRGVVPGTYLNTLPAANVSGSVTVNGVTTTISPVAASTASLTVTSVLSAAKSFMPAAVSATGGVSRVTVQINNVGLAPLTNVQVTDPLPAGLAVANPANASTTCNGLTILNAVPGSAVAQLQGATVAAGIPCLFQFDAVTTGTVGMTASVNTVPAVTGVVADGGIYNITPASATLTKVAAPGVSVTKSFNPATLMAVGQTARLQITINNAGLGAIALSNLGLIDNLPLGVVLAATPAVSTTCAGGTVQASPGGSVVALSGGSLPAGSSCVFEANITLTSIGTHNNTLPIGIVTNNENITNTAAFTANLQTQSPIGVQKSFAPTSVGVNTPSRLTIQLISARDVTVNSLTVADALPLGLIPAVPSAASTTCPGGGVSVTGSVLTGYQVSMSGASLAGVPPGTPGTVCEVSLNVQSPTAGVFINTIPTNGASAIDSVSGLLMANLVPTTATLEVRDTTVLAQAFAAPSVKLGVPNRLTITISNPNSIPLTAVSLTDGLPAQVSVALVPNATTTCVGGLISASAGSSSIRLSGATIPAAAGLVSGSCTVSVDVLSNVPGTYTNTLPAGAVQSNEGVSNLQPVSASFSTFNLPTLGKEFLPVQIAANGAAKLRIVLGNSNPTAVTLSANMDDSLPTSPAALAFGAPAIDTTTLDVLPRCVGAVTLAAPNRVRVPLNTSIPAGGCVVIANVTGAAAGSYNNLIPAGTLQTNAGNNPLPANATLQISARNSISGKVFRDDNNDGVPALSEPGIAAQAIELLDGLTLAPLAATVTDSLGNYTFLDLADGMYAVRQPVQPVLGGVLTLSGRTTPGSLGALVIGTATPVTLTPSVISAIALVGGQNATGFYFGEILPASLAGSVFADRNNDGVLQASDTPLAGVSIQLTGTDDLGNLINQTVPTAADGSYRFTTLRPGTYALTELSQPLLNGVSTVSGKTVPGAGVTTPGLATPVSVTPSAVTGISVQGNQAGTGFNFAELPAERSLAGRIYTDLAGDGVFNAGDVGLAGLTVTLSGTDLNGLALTRTALSDALGRYSFAPLPEGSYALSYAASGPAATTSMAAQALVGTAGGVGGGIASAGAALQTSAISLTGMVTAGSNYDFTRAPASSIAGRIYQDTNNNGVFEPAPVGGDVGLAGVTVTLSGTNDLGAAVNQSTTTAADGSYSFTGLRPGTYSVTEQATQPAGTLNGKTTAGSAGGTATALATSPSAINTITLPVGVAATGYEFAELGASALSGRVYQDANNNGVFEPAPAGGDVGLPGVTVTLTGTNDLGAAVNQPTTTAADGSYSFTGLRPGTYAVTETEPAGLLNGKTTAGSAGGTATPVTTVPSTITAITLTAGSAATGYEFADLGGTSLSGRVYQDKNNNGVFEPAPAGGDVGLPSVTVTLTGTDDLGAAVIKPTTTAADGSYSFTGLRPGTYAVTETEPAGLLNGKTTAGTAGGTATAVTTVPSAITAITLTAGSAATGYEFADLGGTSLSGRVYQDKNNNGVFEPAPAGGDVGLPGVTVTLTGTDDLGAAVIKPTTTAADGSYSFTGLRPGTYAVTETEPAGLLNGKTTAGTAGGTATAVTTVPSAISVITLTAGSAATGYEFADLGGTSLSGRVYQDKNNNGIFDPAPAGGDVGLPGVTVTLTGTDDLGAAVTKPTTTAADGSYSFTGLRPGTYAVTESEPAGLLNGKTTAGSAGGTATPVTTVPSAITVITLTAGSAATGYEFADLGGTSLSGRVYQDKNNNGVFEPAPAGGDVGLPGVTVTLTGTNDLGAAVNQPTTTAADGSYSFTGLRPGTYAVTETEPAGLLNGKTTAGTAGGTATSVTTVPSAITAITFTAGSAATGYEFADLGGTSLSGRVYQDKNNNGVFEPAPAGGDVGLPGVTVTLTGTDDLGAAVTKPTTTAVDGSYSFTGLRPGTYAVTETEPAGLLNGKTTAGSAGGTVTPVTTVPSAITAIPLTAGSAATGYEFADLGGTSLTGRVYQDKNNNGVFEPAPAGGDVGLAGVTVTLTGTNDLGVLVNQPTTTAVDGSYSFTGLRPGTYAVTETEPVGLLNGKTTAGSAGGTATPVTTVPSAITAITLTAGSAATGYEFADLGGTSLTGRVYQDKNNNGVFEPAPAGGDVGLPGVTVTLTGTDDLGAAVIKPTTTAADGSYSFTGLRPGTYAVTETEPAGMLNGKTTAGSAGGTATPVTTVPSAITAIALTAGSAATGYEFADLGGTSLSGRVYQDKNNNGVFEPAPAGGDVGLPVVTVTLTGTDDLGAAVIKPTTTAADGSYSFTGLRPGTYVVTETEPAGLLNGKTTAGSAGGTATPVTTMPSAISGIALTAASVVTGYEFAELPLTADLAVQKTHQPARFTVNQMGTYQISVRNTGSAATAGAVTVQDRLPAGLSLAATPTAVGWMCTGAVGAPSFSCSTSDVIAAGATHPGVITARVNVAAAANTGMPVDNAVLVEGGGESVPQQPTAQERGAFQSNPAALPLCDGTLPQNACRDATAVQLPASMSGAVWVDTGRTPHVFDSGDQTLKDWIVEVSDPATGAVVATARTGADGRYVIGDLVPGAVLDVRFRNPQTQVVFGNPVNGETGPGSSGVACIDLALLSAGQQSSCVDTAGTVSQLKVVLAPGMNLVQQSLPIDPSGITYDTQTRLPVPGTVVTMQPDGVCAGWDPVAGIVNSSLGGYKVQGPAISVTTGADGFYQFLFSANAPTLCDFRLSVTPPGTHGFPSASIPPLPGPLIPPGAPGSTYAVQPSPNPPLTPPGPGTGYYLVVRGGSGGVNIVNNHIPVDPLSAPKLSLSKVADLRSVELGASVRYTVTVRQVAGNALAQATVVDRLPAGFTFIKGTAVLDNLPLADPAGGVGPLLSFQLGALTPGVQRTLQYRVRVGVGALQGDATNRARAVGCGTPAGCTNADGTPLAGSSVSNEGQAKVQVSGGVFASEACVTGKIFVDCNHNHMQDAEELGIPGVRLYMEDGTWLVSDSEGKYSLCGLVPQSHVLKPDPSTLPRGARLTTSSNRNLGDAASLWLDLKNGALQRADFIESSCSNTVLSQVRARRAQGGVRAPETERPQGPPLRFESKAHGLKDALAPQQATETADQRPAIGAPREAEGDRHAR